MNKIQSLGVLAEENTEKETGAFTLAFPVALDHSRHCYTTVPTSLKMSERAKANALFSLIYSNNIQKKTKVKNKRLKAETILHALLNF